jgi:hypothetical protein
LKSWRQSNRRAALHRARTGRSTRPTLVGSAWRPCAGALLAPRDLSQSCQTLRYREMLHHGIRENGSLLTAPSANTPTGDALSASGSAG